MGLPYFPLYPTDFEADTSHLTLEEDGAYNRLLRLMWMTPSCIIPDDPEWIQRRMRIDAETYARVVVPIIEEFLCRRNARLGNARLMREYEKSVRLSEAQKARARKRWETKDKTDAHAMPTRTRTRVIEKEVLRTSKKNGHHPLREDWILGPDLIAYAERYGFSPGEAEDIAEDMRNWAKANGREKKSWHATYQTFVRSEAKRRKENGNGKATNGTSLTDYWRELNEEIAGYERAEAAGGNQQVSGRDDGSAEDEAGGRENSGGVVSLRLSGSKH